MLNIMNPDEEYIFHFLKDIWQNDLSKFINLNLQQVGSKKSVLYWLHTNLNNKGQYSVYA